jgi:eukaryotic-like serine/threonine-protein kinase
VGVTEAVPIREGEMLAGKYRVERVLGSGGMGIVVAAVHVQLEQKVAIKFVRDEALGNTDAVQRFLREARAAVKLKSEHAAKVLDVGTLDSGAPYMVMEYLEGSDLGAVLADHGTLTVQAASEWIVQACEAIAEAHAMGIVHRDIKPQNLFLAKSVGGQAQIKVLDFGVSKSLTSSGEGGLTQTRSMLGSPLYMSPEQMRSSRTVDARADVWALGVVLFELLTKRWPFEAESMPELCLKVVSDPPVPVQSLRSDVPRVMADVIARCLQKDPAKRFANAAELASALEPLAPPASRAVVERARLAMGSMPDIGGGSVNVTVVPASAISAPHPLPDALAHTAMTPATWDSSKGASMGTAPGRGRALWIGLGAAVVGGGLVAALLLRGHDTPPVTAAPAPTVAPAPVPQPSAPVTALVALPSAPPAVPAAPSAAPSASVAAVAPLPRAAPGVQAPAGPGKTPSAPAAQPAAPGKPKPPDDDIPSLR